MNPHRPRVPDEIRDISPILHDYLQDQAGILRAQHNKIQAGDTTFPWEILTYCSERQEYTLGSLGKFENLDYGLIHARYCKFQRMSADIPEGSPVGLLANEDSPWHVTNQLSQSKPELVVGVAGCFTNPANDTFGWVIVSGINIQTIYADAPMAGEERVGWSASGLIGLEQHKFGRIKKQIFATEEPPFGIAIPPGALFIDALAMPTKATDLPPDPIPGINTYVTRIQDEITRLGNSVQYRFDRFEGRVIQNTNTFQRSISILSERMASVSPEAIMASIQEDINLSATYLNLASTAANNAADAANRSHTNLTAANESMRTAEIRANEAGFFAESATAMSNEATLARNEAGVSAAAAATSESNAAVSETNAGVSASAANTSATNAATSAGTAGTHASNAATSASAASTSASNAAGSASTASTHATNAANSATSAGNSASAASTSASNASTSASNAATSASAASSSASSASTSAGTATTQASNAATSATSANNSAVAAASSASLAASVGAGTSNNNPSFSRWSNPSSLPDDWIEWNTAPGRTRVTPGEFGSPYANQEFSADNQNQGAYQIFNGSAGYWVIECRCKTSNVFTTAQIRLAATDATISTIYSTHDLILSSEPDNTNTVVGAGTVGRVYSWSKMVQVTNTSTAKFLLYAMTNVGGSGRAITWYRVSARPATYEEIRTGVITKATVDTVAAAMVNGSGHAIAAWETTTVAGGASAAIRMRTQTGAGTYDSTIALEAEEIQLWNGTTRQLAAKVAAGKSVFTGDIQVGGAIQVGGRRINVALQSFQLQAGDGETIDFGTDLVNLPQFIFDTTGLAPKTAAQVYDIKANSLTSTGFTMYAKILTPGGTANVNNTGGSNVGGTPSWQVQKADAADAYNASYTFTITVNVVFDEQTSSEPAIWSEYIEFDCYVRPSGGSWTYVGTRAGTVSSLSSGTIARTIFGTFTYSGAIGQHGSNTEFGIHPIAMPGTITAFSVTYTKQSTSGVSSATPNGEKVLVTVIPQNV